MALFALLKCTAQLGFVKIVRKQKLCKVNKNNSITGALALSIIATSALKTCSEFKGQLFLKVLTLIVVMSFKIKGKVYLD
jgi:hypothetical protein